MGSMRSVSQWVISGGLVFGLALGGLNSVAGEKKLGTPSSSSREVRRLSMVIGGAVRIANNVSVGKIEDVVLNDNGCIDYVVVVYRDQYVAIPWTAAIVDFRQRIVTVDITEERFATVPTFRRDEFSFLTKTEFTQKVHSVFDGKGAPKPKQADEKAESTKSEPKPEPAKTEAQEKPKVESPDKPKDQSLGKPKGESKDKPKK
jgi:PRC-barrel domain